MADVVDLLVQDHKEARTMLKRLTDAKGREAKQVLKELTAALQLHTNVEEEIVYPAYRRCLSDEESKVMVHESLTEHNLVDQVLEELAALPPSSPEFRGKAKVLREMVEHHAKDEEKDMLPRLRKECSKQRLQQLADRVMQRKEAEKKPEPSAKGRKGQGRPGEIREGLVTLSRNELYQRAKEAGIEGRSQMDKKQLQQALKRR